MAIEQMKKKRQQSGQTPQTAAAEKKNSDVRNIFLFGRLENEVTLPVIKRLLKMDEKDPAKPINLFINSAGGNGYNADAIIAVMNQISAKVNTICLGHALSGACEILASGTGERSSYEFATLMFHQTLWEADGDITNLEIQAAQGKRFRDAQIELLHRCTGQAATTLRKDIERDHYMSAEEALSYGIIDKVIRHERGKIVAKKLDSKAASLESNKNDGFASRSYRSTTVAKTTRGSEQKVKGRGSRKPRGGK
jgi:ATP-dependent Clp protease, protease subunit